MFMSKRSYANMAIFGDNLFNSGRNAFLIELRHIEKFILSKTVGEFLVFVGILISFLSTLTFTLIVRNTKGDLNYVFEFTNNVFNIPEIVIFFFATSFAISQFVLGLFDEVIIAILQCVAIDMDVHDGVP